MATDLHDEQQQSVTTLVSGILQDAQELLKQQFELLKCEVREDVRKARAALHLLAIAAGVALVGGVLLGLGMAMGLQAAVPDLPLWACFAIFGAIFLAVGGGIYAAGWGQLHTINPIPERSGDALKENVKWITNPK